MTNRVKVYTTQLTKEILWSSPRPISTAKLNASRHLHTQPINLVVFKGSYSLYDGISNQSASRLDAFSVYPFRT